MRNLLIAALVGAATLTVAAPVEAQPGYHRDYRYDRHYHGRPGWRRPYYGRHDGYGRAYGHRRYYYRHGRRYWR